MTIVIKKLWRARYAILTILAPILVVVIAKTMPSVLRGLLLLRLVTGTDANAPHALGSTDHWTLVMDLSLLTWISSMVVALGLAIFRIISLYGDARMTDQPSEASETSTSDWMGKFWWRNNSIGWPILPTVIWLMISLSYPIFAASETINDARRFLTGTDSLDRDAIVGIAIGLISAIVSLLLFSLLRTVLLGDRSAGSGLFFGEGIAYWIVRKFKKVTRTRSPLFFGFPLHVPGFTDPQTRRLLPGHLQLLIALVASVSVYVFWYYRTTNSATIGFDDWPVGSYLLLVIYCGGAIMSLIAFILDRYRIPIFVVTIAYLSLVSDSHRYFELVPTSDEFRLGELPEGSNSLLMKALATRPADAKDYAEPPYLEELYGKSFQLPVWKDGKRTLVVVTASGGGIQAAGWTARVLTGLEKHSPKLAESIGLISSVSGGSVGVLHYLAHRQPRKNDPFAASYSSSPDEELARINQHATASSIEAIGWGVAFPDFARSVSPFHLNREVDRGWALESSWWNRMGASKAEAKWMKRVRIRDLIEPTRAGQIPPVIFNATAVETGQRVLISPVQGYATRDGAPNDSDYERADVPIDFLRFYSRAAETPNDVNPRLTTAVRLSATFAYVTPVARPLPFDQVSSDANPHNEAARRRLELHLCDGGYSDNTGLVTAVRVVHDLITAYRQKVKDGIIEKPPFERVLFLRIEPFPPNATKIAKDNRGLKSALFGPLTALAATRTSTQAERADLELGLLMDVNKSELRNSQRSLARQLAILKETVQDAESELENEDYVSLKKQLYVLSEMSFDPESEPDRVTLNRQIAVVSNQVRRIQAPDNDTLKSISNVIEMYEDSRDQCESDNVSQIEIKTALFRFDTRPRVPAQLTQDSSVKQATSPNPVQQSKTEKSHNPPLSWRLAMSDVNAIEIAWQGYTKAIKNDGVASAAEDGATEPWQATEESQRDNTLLPHQLIELSAGE